MEFLGRRGIYADDAPVGSFRERIASAKFRESVSRWWRRRRRGEGGERGVIPSKYARLESRSVPARRGRESRNSKWFATILATVNGPEGSLPRPREIARSRDESSGEGAARGQQQVPLSVALFPLIDRSRSFHSPGPLLIASLS